MFKKVIGSFVIVALLSSCVAENENTSSSSGSMSGNSSSSSSSGSTSSSSSGDVSQISAYERGKLLYKSKGCEGCHGADGEGGMDLAGRSLVNCDESPDEFVRHRCENVLALESYIHSAMPPGSSSSLCMGECAADLAVFLGQEFIGIETTQSCDNGIAKASPNRRLNKAELTNSLNDIFGVGGEAIKDLVDETGIVRGFATSGYRLKTDYNWSNSYSSAANAAAESIIDNNGLDHNCGAVDTDCLVDALSAAGRRLFRRTLSAGEVGTLRKYMSEAPNSVEGQKTAMLYMLLSPQFLFTHGESDKQSKAPLTQRELADRIALSLTSSLPDEELINLVENGQLTGATVDEQIERLIESEKFDRFVDFFVDPWIGTNVSGDAYDPGLSGMTQEDWNSLMADMRTETKTFISHIVKQNLPINEILVADYTFVNRRLADHYGISVDPSLFGEVVNEPPVMNPVVQVPVGDQCNTTPECRDIFGPTATDCRNSAANNSVCMCGNSPCGMPVDNNPDPTPVADDKFVKVTLPAELNRLGLLTQGSFLASAVQTEGVSYVDRGKIVLSAIACEDLEVPDSVVEIAEMQADDKTLTEKQKRESRASLAACSSCHNRIDPIGWVFTEFDVTGAATQFDPDGEMVNTSGSLAGKNFAAAPGLAQILTENDAFASCIASRFLIHSIGRDVLYNASTEDKCAIDGALEEVKGNTANLGAKDLFKTLLSAEISTNNGTILD